ncbi:MAG: type II secretion system protein [Opitutaceae bacterium]|jgi:general secretion pathway protein G
MNHPPLHRRPAGFTLIELLAVIAIIGVLAAILFSVLGHVRRTTQETQSLAKLRQIGSATLLYAGENRGGLPVWHNYTTGVYWWRTLQPYIGEDPEVFHSPAHEGFNAENLAETISYGWNYPVLGRHIGDSSKEADHTLIINDFANPSKTLVAADARDYSWGFISADSPPAYGRYGDNIPSVFLDGHVSSRPGDEFRQADPWFNVVKTLPPDKN